MTPHGHGHPMDSLLLARIMDCTLVDHHHHYHGHRHHVLFHRRDLSHSRNLRIGEGFTFSLLLLLLEEPLILLLPLHPLFPLSLPLLPPPPQAWRRAIRGIMTLLASLRGISILDFPPRYLAISPPRHPNLTSLGRRERPSEASHCHCHLPHSFDPLGPWGRQQPQFRGPLSQ